MRAPVSASRSCLVRAATVALAASLALADGPGAPMDPIAKIDRDWRGMDRGAKLEALTRLGAIRSQKLLRLCERWLEDKDPVVVGQVVRLVGSFTDDGRTIKRVEAVLVAHARRHLDVLGKRAAKEFKRIASKYRRKVPPGDQMAAGAGWQDPYDERRRPLPPDVRAERAQMRELIRALQRIHTPPVVEVMLRIFESHPDPEVLKEAVECFEAWKEWRALEPMADLLRIQEEGRMMGGADVIGAKRYATLRLKWDVYKDLLWWSRPEYVPRLKRPIRTAVTTILGPEAPIRTSADLDAYLLAHEAELRAHGAPLSPAFKQRARSHAGKPD